MYFLSLGFSFFQVATIIVIGQIVQFLLEIPTGSFADLYGRKASVLLGFGLIALAFVFTPFVYSYWFF